MPGTETRTIVSTGVTRGLGRALVDRFIEAGHAVIGCGRSAKSIGELQSLYQSLHRFAVLDVSDDAAVAQWACSSLAVNAPHDLLSNIAAIITRNAPLLALPCEQVSVLMYANCKGEEAKLTHSLSIPTAHGELP